MTDSPPSKWRDRLPLIAVVAVAANRRFALRDYLKLSNRWRDNREALLAFRDDNYALTALAFVLALIAIVAFSLPRCHHPPRWRTAGIMVIGVRAWFPRALFNGGGGDIGGGAEIFLAVRTGWAAGWPKRSTPSDGRVKRMTQAIRDNGASVLFSMRLVRVLRSSWPISSRR